MDVEVKEELAVTVGVCEELALTDAVSDPLAVMLPVCVLVDELLREAVAEMLLLGDRVAEKDREALELAVCVLLLVDEGLGCTELLREAVGERVDDGEGVRLQDVDDAA